MSFIVQSIPNPEEIYFEKEKEIQSYFRSKEKVKTKISELIWISSTVGNSTTGENTVDTHIRNSYKGKEPVIITFNYKDKSKVSLNKIFPDFRFEYPYNFTEEGDYIKWEAIRYPTGGFFAKHIDGQEDKNHYGTAIILPPTHYDLLKGELNKTPVYTGGELILEDSIITADKSLWKIVLLTIDTPHELKPVLSGERIIFKTKLKYTINMKYLMDAKIYNQPAESNFKNLIHDIDTKINSLKKEILELEEERESIITGDFHENKFIKEIKNDKGKEKNYYQNGWKNQFIVLLENHYQVPIPDNFNEDDKYTFNLILKQFPDATIRVINIGGQINKGDSEYRYDICFSKSTENYGVKDKNDSHHKFEGIPIYYNFNKGITPGDYINTDSVYNDQTYDTIEICDFTILHVQV